MSQEAVAQKIRQPGLVMLGMHRSGTSCLAGMLQCAGFFGGKVVLWDQHNRRGTREDPRINQLNDLVLQISGGRWDAPPEVIRWTPQVAAERDELLRELADSAAPWMLKDPRTLLTLPLWQEAGADFVRLGIWRNPLSVAQSLATRNGLPITAGLELWAAYNAALLREHQRAPFPVVCFDAPRDSFVAAVEAALSAICGSQLQAGLLDIGRLGEFFDGDLVNQAIDRNDAMAALPGLPGVDEVLVERVSGQYRALCALSDCPEPAAGGQSGVRHSSPLVLDGLIRIETAAAQGDYDAAWTICNEILEHAPHRADIWLRLVNLAEQSGDRDRLARSLRRGLEKLPEDPGLWFEQARLHWAAQAFDAAIEAANKASAGAPDWAEPRLTLGNWTAVLGRWAETEKWLAPLAAVGRSDPRGEMLLGVALIHLGQIERGGEWAAAAIAKMDAEERADGLQRWGLALQKAGLKQDACVRLAESFALNPSSAAVAAALTALQLELGDAGAALETVDRALKAGARSPRLHLLSARIRHGLGQAADQDIAAGLTLDAQHPGLRQFGGNLAYAKGDYSAALEHYLIARAGHNPVDALLGAARCHVRLGNAAAAAACLDELLGMNPHHAEAQRMRNETVRL